MSARMAIQSVWYYATLPLDWAWYPIRSTRIGRALSRARVWTVRVSWWIDEVFQ